ncbi:MAG: 3,4-dehydroadipyl-CoA semialdehyde dehydrogenase, partial [Deltaproteobacteria bacterium]
MLRLQSYLNDTWHDGAGAPRLLVDPSTEAPIAETSTEGLDFAAALHYAREVGGPNLRAMSFASRGELLKAMSRALHAHREELLELSSRCNGATRGDSKFDVDGATGTLAYYASLGRRLGDARWLVDGEAERLSSGARFVGQHVRLPRPGVAVHVNAFNFPAWGTFEKVAVALLAGMPVVSKPATATAALAWRMVRIVVDEVDLPAGVLSFVAGPAGDLLDHLGPQDVLAFTGSASTGATLRAGDAVVRNSVRVNIEADSLNAAVLGPDAAPDTDVWATAVRNIVTDMTQKTGQKCTAIRRILVPEDRVDALVDALKAELSAVRVGVPLADGVDMGPVATAAQLRDVRAGIERLATQAEIVTGGPQPVQGIGAPEGKGYYVAPTLLVAADPHGADAVHAHEVFGPCATILPYDGTPADAAALVARGQGSLVSSLYTDDRQWLAEMLLRSSPWNGRVLAVTRRIADSATPPGMVLPSCVHGGPGRAGGGEELG